MVLKKRNMNKLGLFLSLTLLGSLLNVVSAPPNKALAADAVETIVTAQTGVRTSANSSADLPNADLIGNGDLLVSTYGNPESLSFNVSKTDFWKDLSQNASGSQTNPMPLRVGFVSINIPTLAGGATYQQEQDMYQGEIRTTLSKGNVNVTEKSRVAATAAGNLLITDLVNNTASGLAVTVDTLASNSFVSDGASTSAGTANGNTAWVSRYGPTGLGWGPSYNAFQMRASMSTRVFGASSTVSSNGTTTATVTFTVPANSTVEIVTQVASTGGDALTNSPSDPTPTSNNGVNALTMQNITDYNSAHLAWWSSFWHKSYIQLDSEPLLMRYYYGAQYVLASSNRAGKFPPGLNGWNGMDTLLWQSDYTTNYNIQAPYYGVYSSNHPELAQAYYKGILSINNGHGKSYAISRGFSGTYFKTHYGPFGIQTENNFGGGDWGQKTNALESTINFINDYYYTLDTATLQNTTYPFLIDVANFWDSYLVKDATGRYVVNNSNVAENDSAHKFNPTTALAYLRTFYTGLLKASQDLGLDAGRRALWQDILTNLSTYTTLTYSGKNVFSFSEDNVSATANPYPYNLYEVHPANQVGLSSPLAAIARNTIDTVPSYWAQGNSFPQIYPAAVKAGYPAQAIVNQMKSVLGTLAPNNFLKQSGGGLETAGATEAINSMLLQSTEGIMRLFPNWTGTNASFNSLRAVGAFLVTSQLLNGVVQSSTIMSEKGQPIKVQNPWPGQALIVTQVGGGTISTTRNAGIYSFNTTAGASYTLTPQGGVPSSSSTDIAIYKDAVASSSLEQGGWSAAAALDGDKNSTSNSMGWTSVNNLTSDHTESVTIDLRGVKAISQVDLSPRNDGVNTGYGFPVNFTVDISTDNVNWTTVVSRTGYALPSGTTQSFGFTGQNAQYLRITGTSLRQNPNDSNQYRMQFAEIGVLPYVNLALNKTVTASSSLESTDWGAAKAVDGLLASTAGAMGWTSTNNLTSNHTEWLTVDLGAAQSFSLVNLYPRNDGVNTGYGFPIDFKIQVSNNNSTWTDVVAKTGYALPTGAAQSFSFTAQNAQYLRITGTSLRPNPNDSNQYRMQFAEISVLPYASLALNRAVTASSSLESTDWGAAKAVDGLMDSTAGAMGWTSTSNLTSNHTEWLTVDLGTAQSFSLVNLYPRNDGVNTGYGFPIDYKIQVSNNNSTWTDVVTKTGYALPTGAVQSFSFTAQNARYIRMIGTSLRQNPNDSNQYRMQLAEFLIFP